MRALNWWQCLTVEKIVLDFIQECDVPLMEVGSNTEGEEDTSIIGSSRNYLLEVMELLTKINLFS